MPSYYLKSIVTNNKVNIIKYNNEIKNLPLIDFNEMPNQINNISSELQEELFRIISAPVPEHSYTSYSSDAREHMKKYSWGQHGNKIYHENQWWCSFLNRQEFAELLYKRIQKSTNTQF